MRTPGELRLVVHVAGAPTKVFPGPDTTGSATQRCAVCGFLLIDNTGAMAVSEGGEAPDAAWWPAGALVATDKTAEGAGGMTYVVAADRKLDDNEVPCT
jgi:hypothetical protein